MRRAARFSSRVLVVALALPLAASRLAGQAASAAPHASAASSFGPRERAVHDVVLAFHRALVAHDTAALARIFAPGYTFINDKGQLATRAERLANLGSGTTAVAGIDNEREITVRVYGDNALVQNRFTLRGQYGTGRATDSDVRVSYVLVRRAGRWQLVMNQVTPVAP